MAAAEAIDYAVDHGARIINASWGEAGFDPVIASAIQYADSHGVIIVAAAGNSGSNDTTTAYSPASYSATYPNVITVAATDSSGDLASWSNFGAGTVQLAAPGVDILSTLDDYYGFTSGTSMAAPFVAGTLALVEAAHPGWSMSQVEDAVLDHTTPDPALASLVTTGGIVNAAAAVANADGAYVVAATPNNAGNTAAALTSVTVTFNEEINPATFSPSQATLSGPGGSKSGVSVTPVAGSNDHQFVISFPAQTAPGTYTLTVGPSIEDWYGNAMDQNRNGVNGEASDTFTGTFKETATAATATFIRTDSATQGNWMGAYGSQGFDIFTTAANNPSFATVTPAGELNYTWATSTTDPRALENASGTGRIAACWYAATSFTIKLSLTDGQPHDVSLYALDFDKKGRSEQIQITSAATGAVLDTETLANFSGGIYLQWQLSGNVVITVKTLAGPNAVLSGLFIDPPAASPDSATALSVNQESTGGVGSCAIGASLGPIEMGTVSFSDNDRRAHAGNAHS